MPHNITSWIILLIFINGCSTPKPYCGEWTVITDRQKRQYQLYIEHDYFAGLACAAAQNKPLFVYFTCHGCMGYHEFNNDLVGNDTLRNLLNEHFVCVSLPVDDMQKLDSIPEQQLRRAGVPDSTIGYIREKNTLGALNGSLQAALFNTNSQPFYVLMNHSGKPLVQPFYYTGKNAAFFIQQLRTALKY